MKKLFSVLLLISLVFCSCSKRQYLNVIPQNPAFVVSVDFKTISEKGELSESPYLPQLTTLLGGMSDKFSEYIKNPAKTGIDFRQPAYFFGDGSNIAMTMAVYDDDDLTDFFTALRQQNACGPLTEKDGIQYTKIEGVKGVVAFNKHTVLYINSSPEIACQLLAQQQENSFTATKAYENMTDADGEILVYGNFAALPSQFVSSIKSILPEGIRYTDVEAYSVTQFLDGKFTVSAHYQGKTKEAQRLIEEGGDLLRKIKGDYIQSPPSDFLLWLCMGVEKGAALDIIKKNPFGHDILLVVERAIDIEQILRQVKDDVAVIVSQPASSSSTPEFMFLANVADDSFLGDVDYWQKSMTDYGMSMSRTIGNNFAVKNGNNTTYLWGVEDNQFYISTSDMFSRFTSSRHSDLLKACEEDIRSCYFYIYFNVQQAIRQLNTHETPICAFPVWSVISAVKSVVYQSEEYGQLDIITYMNDDLQNSLKTLFHATDTTH